MSRRSSPVFVFHKLARKIIRFSFRRGMTMYNYVSTASYASGGYNELKRAGRDHYCQLRGNSVSSKLSAAFLFHPFLSSTRTLDCPITLPRKFERTSRGKFFIRAERRRARGKCECRNIDWAERHLFRIIICK